MVAQSKTAKPTVVNGINVVDLFTLIDGVKRTPQKARQTGGSRRPGRARRGAVRKSRVLKSAENGCHAGSRSTSMSPANWEDRTFSPIRRNI
ncbi:MAG TPA: hypothetical protein VGA15_20180 [Bradyrhizobium sp.]